MISTITLEESNQEKSKNSSNYNASFWLKNNLSFVTLKQKAMYKIKFHFGTSKRERNGIFVFVGFILCFQLLYYFIDFYKDVNIDNESQLKYWQTQLDSLNRPKKFVDIKYVLEPFNPNYMSDYRGYLLGLTPEELDRLWEFREKRGMLYTLADFQKVTKISDSMLQIVRPKLKFPRKWKTPVYKTKKREHKITIKGINSATYNDLIAVKGIGDYRAKKILELREKLQGITYMYQLKSVWKLPESVYKELESNFEVLQKPKLNTINVNEATLKQLMSVFYIDYKLARRILDFRTEFAEITNLAALKKIEEFPLEKYELISLYLRVD